MLGGIADIPERQSFSPERCCKTLGLGQQKPRQVQQGQVQNPAPGTEQAGN